LEEGIRKEILKGEYNLENNYDSMKIRREAVRIIGKYNRTMWTGPVRVRDNLNGVNNEDAKENRNEGDGRNRVKTRERTIPNINRRTNIIII